MVISGEQMRQEFEELKQRVVMTEKQIAEILSKMGMSKPSIELDSMNDALNRIGELDCNEPDHEEELYNIAFVVGANLHDWDYDFDLAKNTLVSAARNVGFRSKFLAADLDNCLIEGMAESIEKDEVK